MPNSLLTLPQVVMKRTPGNFLAWRFGKYHRRRNLPRLQHSLQSEVAALLESAESTIARIPLANWNDTEATEAVLTVTDRRVLRDAEELIRWSDVVHYHWIDRDITKWGELKATHFQRIILDAIDGRVVVLATDLVKRRSRSWNSCVGG